MSRRARDSSPFHVREHERDDCAHYDRCLTEAAKGEGRYTAGHVKLPCESCPRFERVEPIGHSAWQQRGDWRPDPL